jgi:hypothetical protein
MAHPVTVDELNHLRNVYRLYVDRGWPRSAIVEREIGIESLDQISQDDRRNEPDNYIALFGGTYSPLIVELYEKLMRSMRGKRFDECDDEFAGLEFVQAAIMKAIYSYRADRTAPLARFAGEFDRLDVPNVRQRLYEMAQSHPL